MVHKFYFIWKIIEPWEAMVMKTLNTYMHNIGVIWLNAPSTIMDSRKNCYLVASGLKSVVGHLPSGDEMEEWVPRLG
jgi:hypothetical protein